MLDKDSLRNQVHLEVSITTNYDKTPQLEYFIF